jgi:hypothetical protein
MTPVTYSGLFYILATAENSAKACIRHLGSSCGLKTRLLWFRLRMTAVYNVFPWCAGFAAASTNQP